MKYERLALTYQNLENEPGLIKKTEILTKLFLESKINETEMFIQLVAGRAWPMWSQKKLDFGKQLAITALSRVTGMNKRAILDAIKTEGDLGNAAEKLTINKGQETLFSKELDVKDVFSNLRKLSEQTGAGSVDKKIALVTELLSSAKPVEAKYIIRTVTEDLRIGVGDGVMKKAIAAAFDVDESSIERAQSVANDYAKVAKVARTDGEPGLLKLTLEANRPIKVMLAYKSESMSDALEKVGGKGAIEYKFDGFRVQIHKKKNTIRVFTRRLEDVTKQFPDIVEAAKRAINVDEAIIEGEAVGIKNKKFLPFQTVSRRIKRKYDIEKTMKEIPVVTFLFDIMLKNGENEIDKPFEKRRKILESIIDENESMRLTEQLITDDVDAGKKYYLDALAAGLEGVMVKNLSSPYKPGARVGHMLKLKPTMETLDLIVTGAEWGEGRRASWLGSFILGVQSEDGIKTIGKMATGLTDAEFLEITKTLKPLITSDDGKVVCVNPKVVFEVAYEEIQKSTKYESGYALRFPRLVRVREDKGIADADNVTRVELLYSTQRGKSN